MPYVLKIQLNNINEALQVGDTVYYTNSNLVGNSYEHSFNFVEDQNNLNFTKVGVVDSIDLRNNSVNVSGNFNINPPSSGDYLFFTKDNIVNLGYIKGYYAEMKMISTENKNKSEIFRITLAADESSK
jgi:hypothetical protein